MDDRRTALAILLCIFAVMFYSELFISPLTRQPVQTVAPTTATQPPVATQPGQQTQLPTTPFAAAQQPAGATVPRALEGAPTAADYARVPELQIENEAISGKLSLLGGRITSWKLKRFRTVVGGDESLDLISVGEGEAYPLAIRTAGYTDQRVEYTVTAATESCVVGQFSYHVPKGAECLITLSGTLPDGVAVRKQLSFTPDSYLFGVEIALGAAPADGSAVWLEWSQVLSAATLASKNPTDTFTVLDAANKIQNTAYSDEVAEDLPIDFNGQWVALNSLYFTSAIVPLPSPAAVRLRRTADSFRVEARAASATGGQFKLYSGPKSFEVLQNLKLGLERTIDLGWFAVLSHPLLALLRFFYSIVGNYGLAIVMLTLLIKIIFLPLNRISFLSMKAMQDLQPEVKALKERIKDPTQLNQETMALYKKRGVNPMGGCLPIVVQIPVFFGLYSALLHAIELRHSRFALWVHDLSAPEALEIAGINVPVMILIFGLSMFLQVYTSPKSADPMQRRINLAMPLVFTVMFIIFPFPAGLVVYWLTNNIISIVQQIYLRRGPSAKPLIPTLIASVVLLAFGYALTLI